MTPAEKNTLNKIQEATRTLADQIEIIKFELAKLEQASQDNKTENPNTETTAQMLLECGFFNAAELETVDGKGLITWIRETIKPELPKDRIKETIKRVAIIHKKSPRDNKIPYLKSCLKREVYEYKKGGGQL